MEKQEYFDKMVEFVYSKGFRMRIRIEYDYMEEYYSMYIESADSLKCGWLNQFITIKTEELNKKFYFHPIVNIYSDNFNMQESKWIMKYWTDSMNLCSLLNKLLIPYIDEYEGEDGLIQYLKTACKKINKRLNIEQI